MLPSVRAFLSGIIDYAGLFPPAQLPLNQAIRNYAHYRTAPEGWMLARFVCPSEQLLELATFCDSLFQPTNPLALSVIVTANDFEETVHTVVPVIEAIRSVRDERVIISSADFRLRFASTADNDTKMSEIGCLIAASQALSVTTAYFEDNSLGDYVATINELRRLAARSSGHLGYKLRCGGLHASAIPSVEQVANVIAACRDAAVPLKFTAGLHHPIRHYDASVQTHMHGFLNVFGAGILAHARRLSEEQTAEIIADEDASHFAFTEDGFHWKDHFASVAKITAARQQAVISFGSCSFDEPRDDLRKLGLM